MKWIDKLFIGLASKVRDGLCATDGGEGSGNHGHGGRPGEVGGSAPKSQNFKSDADFRAAFKKKHYNKRGEQEKHIEGSKRNIEENKKLEEAGRPKKSSVSSWRVIQQVDSKMKLGEYSTYVKVNGGEMRAVVELDDKLGKAENADGSYEMTKFFEVAYKKDGSYHTFPISEEAAHERLGKTSSNRFQSTGVYRKPDEGEA